MRLPRAVRDPVLMACALVFCVGITIAGIGLAGEISSDPQPTQIPRGGAAAMSILHPSGTPDYMPVGIPCDSGDLAATHYGGNGASGRVFVYISLVNVSAEPCDLPIIEGIEGLSRSGESVFSTVPATPIQCAESSPFCVSNLPLRLTPEMHLSTKPFGNPREGTAVANISYSSGCYAVKPTPVCTVIRVAESLVLKFSGGLGVSVALGNPMRLYDGAAPQLQSLTLVDR